MRKFYFLGGLPRSGSTLLANILAQNPRFHSTSTSGVMDMMNNIKNNWNNNVANKASPNEKAKKQVLKGLLYNFYEDVEKPVVFDKGRGWISFIPTLEEVLGEKVKIIVPVRDIRDVVASFEKLWRKTSVMGQVPQEAQFPVKFQSMEGRTEVWMQAEQPVGSAYNRILDAIRLGFSDRLLFVDFNDLTASPKRIMADIYKFLGEEPFEHNFENVEQVTWEDDTVHGFKGLHDIRSKVEPMKPQWPTVLGKQVEHLGSMNFWKNEKI